MSLCPIFDNQNVLAADILGVIIGVISNFSLVNNSF